MTLLASDEYTFTLFSCPVEIIISIIKNVRGFNASSDSSQNRMLISLFRGFSRTIEALVVLKFKLKCQRSNGRISKVKS